MPSDTQTVKVEAELNAMAACWDVLLPLPYHAKERVLNWLAMKLREEPPSMGDQRFAQSLSQVGQLGRLG